MRKRKLRGSNEVSARQLLPVTCGLLTQRLGSSSLVAQMVKNLCAGQETQIQSLGWKDSLEKGMATHSSFLPGEFQGQRSLKGYSSRGLKECDRTEQLILSLSNC